MQGLALLLEEKFGRFAPIPANQISVHQPGKFTPRLALMRDALQDGRSWLRRVPIGVNPPASALVFGTIIWSTVLMSWSRVLNTSAHILIMRLIRTILISILATTGAAATESSHGRRLFQSVATAAACDSRIKETPAPAVVLLRPTTTFLESSRQNDGNRVLSIPRGGGWFSDTAKEVEDSAASAKAKAKAAYDSASSKTKDEVVKAKATADKEWMKRVDDLEKRLRDEKTKASERMAAEQKRLTEKAEKERATLEAKIDRLQRKLNEEKKKKKN